MEKVTKVSIGNIVFSLEEKAQSRINSYLQNLEQHYDANPNAREIIDGIEDRMAELLIERAGEDRVISEPIAVEVISILGNPETIDEECGEKGKDFKGRIKRKLYRNLSNRKLGGVCSGLAEFVDRDATLFRLIFGGLGGIFILENFFHMHIGGFFNVLAVFGGFFFVGYLFLWVFLPAAKTLEQRCAMKGDSPTIDSIQRNVEDGVKDVVDRAKEIGGNKHFWSMFGTLFSRIFGLAFILIAVIGLTLGVLLFFGVFSGFADVLDMLDGYAFFTDAVSLKVLIKVLMVLVYFIPFVGMLYSGMMMMFGFNSPKWKPGFLLFIIWVVSLLSLVGLGVSSSSKFFNGEHRDSNESMVLERDTLYIEFVDVSKWEDEKAYIEADRYGYNLIFVVDSDQDNFKIIDYPRLTIRKNSNNPEIRVSSTIFPEDLTLSQTKDILKLDFYRFDGTTLYLEPIEYSRDNPVSEIKRRVVLSLDEDVTVIVKQPIYHEFENDFEYSNIPWLRR